MARRRANRQADAPGGSCSGLANRHAPPQFGGAVATDARSYFAAISAAADGTLAVRPPPAVALVSSARTRPVRNCIWSIAAALTAAWAQRGSSLTSWRSAR